MIDVAVLFIAAFLAGGLNAVAGGGSFLTFPALVFVGIPPVPANATSAVSVFPGYLSSALGFIPEIKSYDRKQLWVMIALSIAGGVLGALLLLITPSAVFSFIVPWLLLFATLLFMFDKQIRKFAKADSQEKPIAKTAATLLVTTYGGYFNGGLGIVLLALFSGLGFRDINLMNGLKNTLSFILSAASVATFALAGLIYWKEAGVMMIAAVFGGYFGARITRKMPQKMVRAVVIVVGLAMTVVFFMRG